MVGKKGEPRKANPVWLECVGNIIPSQMNHFNPIKELLARKVSEKELVEKAIKLFESYREIYNKSQTIGDNITIVKIKSSEPNTLLGVWGIDKTGDSCSPTLVVTLNNGAVAIRDFEVTQTPKPNKPDSI